ncbi:FkbM family methyltransferase [Chthonobacter rhizosphaerae]|uniref:FkbM family methyltransferase n=1 Tax=Chthonobacter rhizosphaerae TaxID=2735553 RepID=UPI0015EFC26E
MTVRPALLAGIARSLAVYYGQPWKTAALRRLYAGIVRPGDLAFDIGCHVGNRTRALHRLGARVVALEPQPDLHALLARILPADRVVLLRKAAGAAPGRLTLAVSSRHPTVSTLSRSWIDQVSRTEGFAGVRWDDAVEVEVVTLDGLIAEHGMPRFVKIDVEGFEPEILAGLSRPVPWVAFEYLPATRSLADACLGRLAALGPYRFNRTEGEDHRFRHADWLDAAAMAAVLAGIGSDERSGDVYARLDPA